MVAANNNGVKEEAMESMVRIVDHSLYGQSKPGTVTAKRIGKGLFLCKLPDESREYILAAKKDDLRSLVVFDGTLLPDGLPEGGIIAYHHGLGKIWCPLGDILKRDQIYPGSVAPEYKEEDGRVEVEIFRYFLLLPFCDMIICKYAKESMRPILTTVSIFPKDGTKGVEWGTVPLA